MKQSLTDEEAMKNSHSYYQSGITGVGPGHGSRMEPPSTQTQQAAAYSSQHAPGLLPYQTNQSQS